MTQISRRRVIVEVDQKAEYLAEVIRELQWLERRKAMSKDRFFDKVVDHMDQQMKLVHNGVFRFNSTSMRHHQGDRFKISGRSIYRLDKRSPNEKCEDGVRRSRCFFCRDTVAHGDIVEIPPVEELTPGALLNAINLLLIQEVLSL